MRIDIAIPKKIDHIISGVNSSCAHSCPLLKPMAKRRSREINLELPGGISKSL